jgi:hypothetical protein
VAISQQEARRLRKYPQKQRWSPAEALATVEAVEGACCIGGVPIPGFALGRREDTVRWANAVRVASMSSGDHPGSFLVQAMARTLYDDRETYSD